jgi:hypothetical protein
MYQLKVKPGTGNQKTMYFINPKCGHELSFSYSTPTVCQAPNCSEKPPQIDRLEGDYSTAARVKYFAEGKL